MEKEFLYGLIVFLLVGTAEKKQSCAIDKKIYEFTIPSGPDYQIRKISRFYLAGRIASIISINRPHF